MQHWFVYYKLDPRAVPPIEPRLRDMLEQLAACGGVRARLMRRVDAAEGPVTLLEVYDGIEQPEAFERALNAAVAHAGLPAMLVGERRTERFEEL